MERINVRRLKMTISLTDFNKLSEKEKKKALESFKKEVGVGGIVQAWDISRSKVYSMLRKYNISNNSKGRSTKKKRASCIISSTNQRCSVERLRKKTAHS
jgi:hypothetical protein